MLAASGIDLGKIMENGTDWLTPVAVIVYIVFQSFRESTLRKELIDVMKSIQLSQVKYEHALDTLIESIGQRVGMITETHALAKSTAEQVDTIYTMALKGELAADGD